MHDHHHDHDDHGGFARDIATLMGRRRALQVLGGLGLIAVVGCSDDDTGAGTSSGGSSTTAGGSSSTGGGTGARLPEETAGPYPGDGSNGPNVLDDSGVVRSDIRSSFGGSSGTAEGADLTLDLVVVSAGGGAPLPGAAVYAWHCDREGRYSLYSSGAEDQNYLRGVQPAGTDGRLQFTTIFPGAYSGRWPHIHFEVYDSLDDATSGGAPRLTSQLALPKATCDEVYAAEGYEASVGNMARTSLDSDMVFSDGYASQLASVTSAAAGGYTAALTIVV